MRSSEARARSWCDRRRRTSRPSRWRPSARASRRDAAPSSWSRKPRRCPRPRSRCARRSVSGCACSPGATGGAATGTGWTLRAGLYDVVVGTRPAVFAPVADLGLLFVSRESHPAHHEDRAPYHHVRDVALRRAQLHGGAVVLEAFCPSSEAAGLGLPIAAPRERRWPKVEVVRPGTEGRAPRLVAALKEARRAFVYAPVPGAGVAQVCRSCGAPAACASCGGLLRLEEGADQVRRLRGAGPLRRLRRDGPGDPPGRRRAGRGLGRACGVGAGGAAAAAPAPQAHGRDRDRGRRGRAGPRGGRPRSGRRPRCRRGRASPRTRGTRARAVDLDGGGGMGAPVGTRDRAELERVGSRGAGARARQPRPLLGARTRTPRRRRLPGGSVRLPRGRRARARGRPRRARTPRPR